MCVCVCVCVLSFFLSTSPSCFLSSFFSPPKRPLYPYRGERICVCRLILPHSFIVPCRQNTFYPTTIRKPSSENPVPRSCQRHDYTDVASVGHVGHTARMSEWCECFVFAGKEPRTQCLVRFFEQPLSFSGGGIRIIGNTEFI